MTVLVSVKINDGIVMATDSASTFFIQPTPQVYGHANKLLNLRKGMPIGVMATGVGGIGRESLETLFKDFRVRLSGESPTHLDWTLDPLNYTMSGVADRLHTFLVEEKAIPAGFEGFTLVRLCGYSAGQSLAEVWDVPIVSQTRPSPVCAQDQTQFGPLWQGEREAIDRLLFGHSSALDPTLTKLGLMDRKPDIVRGFLEGAGLLCMEAMPIQDAIDLARYLVEVTIGYVRFRVGYVKTVGGTVEIAAITKHEGFRWVQRKNFYQGNVIPDGSF